MAAKQSKTGGRSRKVSASKNRRVSYGGSVKSQRVSVRGKDSIQETKVSAKPRSTAAKKRRVTATNPHIGGDALKDIDSWLKNDEFRAEYERVRQQITVDVAVKRIMKHQKWTVRTLAKKMGTSLSQVQRLTEGKNVTIDTLSKFAAATNSEFKINLK